MRRVTSHRPGQLGAVLALTAAAGLLGGCSSTETFSASRFTSLFGGSSSESAPAASTTPALDETDCPTVEIRPGAASLAVSLPSRPGSDPEINNLRYQLNFGETARECRINAGTMTIKVGVQGRVVLGPAGGPGPVSVPLRYAVVREGPEPKPITSKFHQTSVTVPPNSPNTPFTVVVDDISFPVPPGGEIDAYVIYVGFDPQGASARPPSKAKAAPKRQR
jgi:hypothetical protein